MASTPKERQSDALDIGAADSFTEAGSMSLSSSDDYLQVQVGGGRREPSPIIVTPTRLHQKIKATGRDASLVRDASFHRSQLPKQATPLPTSKETTTCDNPFLSPSNSEPFRDTAPSVAKGPPKSSEETPWQ
ncbi:hypothetical protein PISMIDRAFT_15735 [Pisolithus microcarpus 441]|uniref:Uncharacterized protein n=1 Tax=Pisolithus microcarpus 441 TaxID=765257 RepID=A0A0C9Z2H4_9AGAM|nr:hypothetical protein PISMIDRAFT_15735 [Pisolithus microcarpus 441]